jgi:hypothetical protein
VVSILSPYRDVLGSNLGPETNGADRISWFIHCLQERCWVSALHRPRWLPYFTCTHGSFISNWQLFSVLQMEHEDSLPWSLKLAIGSYAMPVHSISHLSSLAVILKMRLILPTDLHMLTSSPFNLLSLFWNKKFWEEIIAYFPFIRHGPHTKRRVQQFFYCCVCIRCRDNVFTRAVV